MVAIKNWTKKLPAVALIICGVLFCNGQGQLSPDNNGALNEITEYHDETELDPDWMQPEDEAFLRELSWDNVPLQYAKRRKNQVFSAGLFGKRSGWNQGHQNGLFGKKRLDNWLEEYMSGREDQNEEAGNTAQFAKRQWNPNQQTGGLFGKRNNDVARRTYEEMLQSLHDKVESALDKRSAANIGRVRTKSSGQHVFRTGGLFGKRSAEEPGMQRALWPEDEQRRK